MAQEDVLIKFEVDYTELDNAISSLEKTGKLDPKVAQSFSQAQKAISSTASDANGLINQFKNVASASVKMGKSVENAFGAGVQDALDEAGVSVDQFTAALKNATKPATSLKKELRALKEAMARAKAEGKDTGKQFDDMRTRAGKLADAIQDANAEIKNAGSDTRGIDNIVGSISALAGGYSALQGAAALFGDESEDLQKTLVKVNGAMALATGLQQTLNALQKEGSLTKLADVIATNSQSAAQAVYAVAVGTSTGAMKAFRIALLATGIGAIVAVLLLAADAMGLFGSATKLSVRSTEDLNKALEEQDRIFTRINDNIQFNNRLRLEQLRQQGVSGLKLQQEQVNLSRTELDALIKQRDAAQEELSNTEQLLDEVKKQIDDLPKGRAAIGFIFRRKELKETQKTLEEQIEILKKNLADRQNLVIKSDQDIIVQQAKINADAADARREAQIKAFQKGREELKRLQKEALDGQIEADKNYIMAALKNLDDQEEQLRIHYENENEIRAAAAEERLIKEQETAQRSKDIADNAANAALAGVAAVVAAEDAARAKRIKAAQQMIQVGRLVADFYSQLSANATEFEFQRIDEQKRQLASLEQAGAITDKQARIRRQQIEIEERRAAQRRAVREKNAAVFKAFLAVPEAFLNGLSSGGPVLGAIYAALALAQAIAIASRPIPKFFKGKKDKYEGPGMVADMGAELVERKGRMYLYTKPTETYLGAQDKVYTAAETKKILHSTNINTTIERPRRDKFDYNRLAAVMPKNNVSINIEKDFISEAVANGLSRNNYFVNRYQFKR